MSRKRTILGLTTWVGLMLTLHPVLNSVWAQETPRTDPTASTDSGSLTPPVASPTTHPSVTPDTDLTVVRGKAGFWQVGKDRQGVWWFVSPTGDREFMNGVTTVQPTLQGRQRDAADYISRDYDPQGDRDGALDVWAKATLQRVKHAGFKGMGAWSHPVLHKYDLPMTRDLNVWTWLREQTTRLYSPEWVQSAETTIKAQVEPLRENRNLIGYYTDNELDWGDSSVGPAAYFDRLPPTDPSRTAVTNVIKAVWPTPQAFNGEWHSNLTSWADLDGWTALPRDPQPAYARLGTAWLYQVARDYFRMTSELVRKYDPNHLVLGVRYRGYMPSEVVAASRGMTDAQSVNYYVSDALLDRAMFQQSYELADQPIIITEYSFHSLDGRSGNRNVVGFPSQVLDQQARAEAYKLFTTRLSRVPYIIGADWFQWMDEPPSGRRSDGEDANFGVVDIDDRAYDSLESAIRQTTPQLNGLHECSANDPRQDVWRNPDAPLPTARIPYLDKPPRLNGELADWPASARLSGVQAVHSVGSERSKLALPSILVGWRDEGVYLAFEVFDDQVTAAPADGWWWSRDNIEFWISTRPVRPDQKTYDVNCHHFFYVPVEFPSRDGVGGMLGQWFVPGSAITATQLPHPDARIASRVLADRYVVEIFLPAKMLNGFDPQKCGTLEFNANVRNYQQAAEYFWSAPKLTVTQARPNTWGHLILDGRNKAVPIAPIAGGDDLEGLTGE